NNFYKFLDKYFGKTYTSHKSPKTIEIPVHHIYFDVNNLLYGAVRGSKTDTRILSFIYHNVSSFLRLLSTKGKIKNVVFAIDGVGPHAKLNTQRIRRLEEAFSLEREYIPKFVRK